MQIPSYRDALDRHETPLDIFISRWEPVHKTDKKTFLEDLSALIAYIEDAQQSVQRTAEWTCPNCEAKNYGDCWKCGKPRPAAPLIPRPVGTPLAKIGEL